MTRVDQWRQMRGFPQLIDVVVMFSIDEDPRFMEEMAQLNRLAGWDAEYTYTQTICGDEIKIVGELSKDISQQCFDRLISLLPRYQVVLTAIFQLPEVQEFIERSEALNEK